MPNVYSFCSHVQSKRTNENKFIADIKKPEEIRLFVVLSQIQITDLKPAEGLAIRPEYSRYPELLRYP